ncbi:MAG: hypothetical protein KF744_07010 [Taibaiella sp.]|nr:hypothetical protein [Taibaiella sp.]
MPLIFLLLLGFMMPHKDVPPVKYLCQHNLDEYPSIESDPHMQGIWKLREDTDSHNYFVVERDGNYRFSITYMNRSGDNRGLEHAEMHFSKVNDVTFLNAPYSSFFDEPSFHGNVLLRLDSVSTPRSWNVVFTLVTDNNLYKMKDSHELREYVANNMKKPGFYGKQLHFRKKFEFNSFR